MASAKQSQLHASLIGLVGWAERHGSSIAEARAAYDAAADRSPETG
ncbi:hypothetical protein [Streptomyces ossamyceticus]|nr:hypothetical protein [Streptomyces ossamyceticus]